MRSYFNQLKNKKLLLGGYASLDTDPLPRSELFSRLGIVTDFIFSQSVSLSLGLYRLIRLVSLYQSC
jgi:hypothetical protein